MKPAASSFRLTSRKGSTLSGIQFDLDLVDARQNRRARKLEVKVQGFAEIIKCLRFRQPLTRNVNLATLRDEPLAFLPHRRREFPRHKLFSIPSSEMRPMLELRDSSVAPLI